ncbi:MAG: YgaP-like transmembrane domain, partial [Chromatocurvus sp.]
MKGKLINKLQYWIAAAFMSLCIAPIAAAMTVSGQVTHSVTGKPVADAIVMVQGTKISTHTDATGRFTLDAGDSDLNVRHITAWRDGYSIAGQLGATEQDIKLSLVPLPADDPPYQFQSAESCGACHTDIYSQWQDTSMGRAMDEKLPQKLEFYLGTREDGGFDGLGFGRKYFAPMMGISTGMHAMNMDHYVGTCVNCHARGITWNEGVTEPHRKLNPRTGKVFINGTLDVFRFDKVQGMSVGQGREGITCDVCHSVQDVRISHDQFGNLETVKIENMEIIRRGDVKFGPYKDAVSPAHGTAYSPIFEKSEFCAMCHMETADDLEGTGTQALLTLDEYPVWKANFDAGKTDKQCQSCHMYTGGQDEWTTNKAATIGVERDEDSLYGHHWRGSYFDGEMARRASNLKVLATREGSDVVVSAELANVGAAHRMPGGPPFRQMLLLIEATDANGVPLEPVGPVIDDPANASKANRIIDAGGGFRKYGFFMWWEMLFGETFPEMPYEGHVGKLYNVAWVTPAFMPMEWMFTYLWIGAIPLFIGVLGWSPLRAMLGNKPKAPKPERKKGFFSRNVGTIDRVLRIVVGLLLLTLVPMPWGLIGLIPLMT